MDELDFLDAQPGVPNPLPRQGEHPGAGIHAGDACSLQPAAAFDEKPAIALAHNQHVLTI
jgi:hypothetical protein